jgi:hypothetical protein
MIRNLVETGNPFAPLLNTLFRNPYFHPDVEQELGQRLRGYNVSWMQLPLEVAAGSRLNGIIGPVFLLIPLGLLTLRRRQGILVCAISVALAVPWLLNSGARFLMPALPFLALAMLLATPRAVAVPLACVHALTAWPQVIDLYAPSSWHLHDFPWRAALRIEPDEHYLSRVSWDYRLAKLVEANTEANDLILDLHGVHVAHTTRSFVGPWQSSAGRRVFSALELARKLDVGPFCHTEATFQEVSVTDVRIEQKSDGDDSWSIQEVDFLYESRRLPNSRTWWVESAPNVWDARFAFDRNLTSRWSTLDQLRQGMFLQVSFEHPLQLTGVRVVGLQYERVPAPQIKIRTAAPGGWKLLKAEKRHVASVNTREMAVAFARRSGITAIVAAISNEGMGHLARSLVENRDSWGLDLIANQDAVYVLRIR